MVMPALRARARELHAPASAAPGCRRGDTCVSASNEMHDRPSVVRPRARRPWHGARHDRVRIVDDAPRHAARRQDAVGFVGAVGKHLGCDAQAGVAAGLEQGRVGQAEQHQRRSNAATARAMASASGFVPARHVVERAVRLDMLQLYAFGLRNASQCGDLIERPGPRPLRRRSASRAGRSRRDRESPGARRPPRRARVASRDRAPHHAGIAGMKRRRPCWPT